MTQSARGITHFVPGRATGIVTPTTLALASGGDADDLDRLVELVRNERDLDDVLATRVTDLAVVHLGGGRADVAARGRTRVELTGVDQIVVEDDRREVEHVRRIVVRVDDGESIPSPFGVERGVVPAAVLDRDVVAGADDPFDAMFGNTIVRTVESAAVRDRGTADPAPLGVLVFSTGERVLVDQPLVLGRNPEPVAELGRARLVKLPGAGVSRRHAAITVDRWRACIDDLGSSNGTAVTPPGRPSQRVRPGQPVDLVTGARVDLGGDVSFVVEAVA